MPTPVTMEILEQSEIFGSLKFVSSSAVGPQITVTFTRVMISPSKALSLIGESWAAIELEGEVLAVDGSFGQVLHPDSGLTSPDIDALSIGAGIVYWKGETDDDYVDMGEAPKLDFTPQVKRLDYFSSRVGVRTKIKSVVTEKSGKLEVILNELTARNLALALMAVID
jgi:hypothetical protein